MVTLIKINKFTNMTYIIAEIGINHDGSQSVAKTIESASKAGANAVKFQYRNLKKSYESICKTTW